MYQPILPQAIQLHKMNKKLFLFLIILLGFAIFGKPVSVSATPVSNLQVVLQTGFPPTPLFLDADFKPGHCVTRWVKLTNRTSENQKIVAKLDGYNDPDEMGKVFDVVIKKHSSGDIIYSGTMKEFYDTDGVTLDPSAGSGIESQYDIKICFQTSAGNAYQGKTFSFDINFIGIWGGDSGESPTPTPTSTTEPTTSPSPSETPCQTNCGGVGGDSGGSITGGGTYFFASATNSPSPSPVGGAEATPEVLGESTHRLPGTGVPPGFLLLISPFAILPFLRKRR
jgi:hypothetical protein